MANTFNQINLVSSEMLAILSNELPFIKNINHDYERTYGQSLNGYRPGATISIPKPARFSVRTGAVRAPQDFLESTVPLTIDTQVGVDVDFTDAELALITSDPDNMNQWSDRYIKPRVTRLANAIESNVYAKMMVKVPNLVGTPGMTPNSWSVIGDAMEKLDNSLAPVDERSLIVNPRARNKLSDSLKGVFVKEYAEKALMRGYLATTAGFDMYSTAIVARQLTGAMGGTPLVNGASQTGASLVTDGWSNSVSGLLKQGDIFTIAGVFMVNPVTGAAYEDLQQFVIQSDAASNGTGQSTLSIYPSIVTSGPTATVSASPADNVAITVVGNASTLYAQNLAFHKDAFAVAFAKLFVPDGTDKAVVKSMDGLSIRYIRDFDTQNGKLIDRLDVLYGFAALYPEWAVRITG